MTFEEKIYHVAVSRGHADAKALAYFLFREVIEEVHAKYNISQEDIKAMNKRAFNRAALYLSLSEKEKEAFKIEAIECDNWDPPECTDEIISQRKFYQNIAKFL